YGAERFSNLSQTPEIAESNPSWSPQGTSLAWAATHAANHSIYSWDASEGPRYIGSGNCPVWSPDGSLLLTGLDDANQTLLTAYRSADGRLELPPIVLPGELTGMTWNQGSLPSPLPQNLAQISTEVQEKQKSAEKYREKLNVRCRSLNQRISNLSGGNQQKVVLARALAEECNVLLLSEPTRGVDVASKAEIYTLIDSLVESGMAILLQSSELPEVVRLANRVMVFASGQSRGELSGDELTQESVIALATRV
ncbi:MAG: ATP-binding cassette domain-containing protein, partial [Anaerolineales bacterium]|nr:ATP-binding cassette domain-containing protein [Anaerolineales bacterium]